MKNDRKLWLHINSVLRKRELDSSQIQFINTVRHHDTETIEHFLAKAKKCYELFKEGQLYISEAWTKEHDRRYDILSLTDDLVFEIETNKKEDKSYDGSIRIEVDKK